MHGKFIVLEGGEGSGKTSAVSWLKDELPAAQFLFTREPGGTENAEEIREVVLKNRSEQLDTFTQILLFEAARREHVSKKIIPALESGTHVICDRFSSSTYAYQIIAGAGAEYEKIFLDIDRAARNGLEPDLTIFLDIEPKVGVARKVSSDEDLNVFDTQNLSFHEKVRSGIQAYLQKRNHVIIDAGKTQSEVREAIKETIVNYTENHAGQ